MHISFFGTKIPNLWNTREIKKQFWFLILVCFRIISNAVDTQDTKGKTGMLHSALQIQVEYMKPSERISSVVTEFSCHSQSHSSSLNFTITSEIRSSNSFCSTAYSSIWDDCHLGKDDYLKLYNLLSSLNIIPSCKN